ncbi:NAD(P)-binding protein [Venturia nashicola]|nr:NAD(P)-binding protein [Venturia nashicola]
MAESIASKITESLPSKMTESFPPKMTEPLPSTMRVWQYSSTKGGVEKNLKLNNYAPLPHPKPSQHLVQVIATALNPVDYKPQEVPVVNRIILPKFATPGIDFAGRIVIPAERSDLKVGQLIFGACGTSPFSGGGLAEYAIVESSNATLVPHGVPPVEVSCVAVAGMTAYQSIVPRIRAGDRVFINGGSGGVGVFGIQMAKAMGAHVTTACSGYNVAFVKGLGADEVIDYRTTNVVDALVASGRGFDHAVDNAGKDKEIFWRADEYLNPEAAIVVVAGEPTLDGAIDTFKRKLLPKLFGGIKGKVEGFWPYPKKEDLEQIGLWIKEGKVKTVFDERFKFEDAPRAVEKLKTGRARGKIVVDVAE